MSYRYQDLSEYNWLMGEILSHETEQAYALADLLALRLFPGTVVDVGCGPGIYLVPFRDKWNCDVYGIDGAPGAGECLAAGEFELVDLRNPWAPPRHFDLALCIEVAEHLLPEHAETLVATIAACSDTIFFTAARPGQGGEGHYNEQPKDYWLNLFSKYGIGRHPQNDALMAIVAEDAVYDHCHWIKWNGMLLGKGA